MERQDARRILEALLFITDQPVPLKAFEGLFDKEFPQEELKAMAEEIAAEYQSRASALELREVAGGWQFSSRTEFAPWIRKLFKDRLTYRLSNSAMETLSIIAYKQPLTRNEIEEIRGVEVSAVLDTLVERRLVKIAGRKESVGRPILFATTQEFLKSFGLRSLEDLPSIESLTPPGEPVDGGEPQTELPLAASTATVESTETTEATPSETPQEGVPQS